MELEITPEPTPEEREAIERAIADVRTEGQESAWWREGQEEALGRPSPDGAPTSGTTISDRPSRRLPPDGRS